MKYIVDLADEAKEDFRSLDRSSQKKLTKDFEQIEEYDISFVKIKHLEEDIYEIIADNIRALFGYKNNEVIVVTVIFLKKTQKTPKKFKERAKRILEREIKNGQRKI